jgi:adenylate cyclase
MLEEPEALAVLFADISRSTLLYEALGDLAAQEGVANCLRLLAEIAAAHRGTLIKTIGDAVMCTFPRADLAVAAAKAMQLALVESPVIRHPGVTGPPIHIGIHLGPVLCKNEDVFGDAVNVAARLLELAKAHQILATGQTVETLDPEAQVMTRCLGSTTVKGKREEYELYEIIWEPRELTVLVRSAEASAPEEASLTLRLHDRAIELGRMRPGATMGRHRENDLVVDDIFVSRIHARIEYRKGKFFVVDMSTNGTYLLARGEESICLHRAEHSLQGEGFIGLGREVDPESPLVIRFSCEP